MVSDSLYSPETGIFGGFGHYVEMIVNDRVTNIGSVIFQPIFLTRRFVSVVPCRPGQVSQFYFVVLDTLNQYRYQSGIINR
jgi:hypothetical protein